MEKFYLRILNGTNTFTTNVIADELEVGENGTIYYFNDEDGDIISAYPVASTIIESIEIIKSVETKSTETYGKIKHNVTEI